MIEVSMHEGTLTEDLFEHVLIHAKEANARRVTRVKVTIGALSDATAESIQFYFSQLAPGTIVAEAALEFESAPGAAKCNTCSEEFEISEIYAACPKCGAFPITVTGGDGVYLTSLEVETDNDQHEHIHE
jgi:hydrogenase nickel incorporation protein HypA/HybF